MFLPGDSDPLIRLDGLDAALAICADTGHRSHPEHAAARGANGYLASMFIIPEDLADDAARMRGYAARHCMLVAMANYGGPTGGLAAGGGSAIWSDKGKLLVQLESGGCGLAVAIEGASGWHVEKNMFASA